jgi:hypothetical protein
VFALAHKLLKQVVDLYEIQYEFDIIEEGLDAIIFNPVTLTIQQFRTFKLLMWMQNFHQSIYNHEILYADRGSEDKQF